MNSAIGKLNSKDFIKGLVLVVLASVFSMLGTAMQSSDFDFATYDWTGLGKTAMTVLFAYLGKNLISDREGNPLGVGSTGNGK